MYIKKSQGPRAVTLPNGRVLSMADLPKPGTQRWVASRKATVLMALHVGLLSRRDAINRYELSEEELSSWQSLVEQYGFSGLKTTKLQSYRQP